MGAMKYILVTTIVATLCFAAGYALVRIVKRTRAPHMSKAKTALASILGGIALMCACGFAYLQVYYHATPEAVAALAGSSTVAVTHEEGAYAFDGPGTDTALAFYPGAKVEAAAYAPLMLKLAEQGMDCFLLEMPFNVAFLGLDKAGDIMARHDYGRWVVAGHSLGGVAASSFAASHADDVDGVALLAAYPTTQINGNVRMCLVYGTEDGCLDRAAYDDARPLWPDGARETVIQGGNHAQFGNYGEQSGDGGAFISAAEQQAQTVRAILSVGQGDASS